MQALLSAGSAMLNMSGEYFGSMWIMAIWRMLNWNSSFSKSYRLSLLGDRFDIL
jgi:hypothetical protein